MQRNFSCAEYIEHVLGSDLWGMDFIMYNLTVPLTRKTVLIQVFKVFYRI